jgi:hypothetical protein
MRLKCKECNSCLDITWVGNRRFYNCFLCQKTYDATPCELKEVKEIVLVKDMNGNDCVERVIYRED